MSECLKEWIILYRSIRRFSEVQVRVHAFSVNESSVYAGWLWYRSVYSQVAEHWSSVYILIYVLAAYVLLLQCSGFRIGVWLQLPCSRYNDQRSVYLFQLLIGEKEFGLWRNSWCLIDDCGSSLKINETRSLKAKRRLQPSAGRSLRTSISS